MAPASSAAPPATVTPTLEAPPGGPQPGAFEHQPPVTIDLPAPSFEETRVTEAMSRKQRLKRQLQRVRSHAYVVVYRAGVAPARIAMERAQLVFGRDPAECDIVLDGPAVSRTHARIERSPEGYFTLQDCKSRNGTYFDGTPIRRMNLVDGDRFEVGEHTIEFHVEEA
jgi:pSer/pThr/pTyr-binding forkhead associated (FHA) protein